MYKDRFDAGETAAEVLAQSKGVDWRRIFAQFPTSFAMVAKEAPDSLRATLKRARSKGGKAWTGPFTEDALDSYHNWKRQIPGVDCKKSVKVLSADVLTIVRAELANQLASSYDHGYDLHDPEIVSKLAGEPMRAETISLLDKSARMWLGLRRLSESKGWTDHERTSRLAVEDFVMRLVEDSPILWAESLHIILEHADAIGDVVETITITLAQKSDEVYSALRFIADHSDGVNLREHARGLLLLVDGAERPKPETVHRLLDQLARWSSTGIMFPHPLSPISKTWLASHDAEAELKSGMTVGLGQFKSDFAAQGAKNERALVQSLLTELSVPFRARSPVTRALGRLGIGQKPLIKLDHRTLVESEETQYGPDIAFLVHTSLRGTMRMDIAEFVQVKKPKRSREAWANSWTIDVQQLNDLLSTSTTAAYWLIDKDGTVLVLPAKYVRAWMPTKTGKTFTIGFNEVRSAAIPVDQFLAELLIGGWLGSREPNVLKIARGEVPGLVPVNLVEVTVSLHGEDEKTQ
jgi:hypothetical protein